MIPTDFIFPTGELQTGLFPAYSGDTPGLHAMLQTWIDQQPGAEDAVVTAWVYHKAYTAVAQRLAMTPNAQTTSGATATAQTKQIGSDRIAHFQRLADRYKEEYTLLVAEESTANVGKPVTSSFVRVMPRW